ncbi:Protein AF-10 [Geodia barretti]|uniref:Protein AF-10 n=1 Tax=Geodia barretti TaxID=519541 RepID=A0AA35X1Q1_GEOBA|nr:Protein AF-10 [Geodia barretti]
MPWYYDVCTHDGWYTCNSFVCVWCMQACYLCEQKGQESHASYGAVMSCHKSSCRMAFHVTCAQKERLLCEEEDSRDSGSLVYCGYCANHYKKMIQKKLKQNLRKQVTTPTSTVAPPLPTVATGTITAVAQSSPQYPSFTSSPPHHKDLAPDPLPVGDHMRPQKTTGTHQSSHSGLGNQAHRPRNKKDGPPQKRMSVDAPIPPAKRKNRRRKLSSSNESSTSETPSNASDFVHAVAHQPLEQARPLAAIGEAGSGGGRRGDRVARREEVLHVAGSYPKMEGGTSHVISPVDVLDNTASGGGSGGGRGKRNSSSRTGGPPLSLQELLETQWQQTAQFILDQAGRQNNAGVMLEHLHKLQSENRTMQSRIMELASQREFYIAMNTRLRQTLADSTSNQLPNGIQTSGTSDGLPTPVPPTQQLSSSSPDFHRSASGERVSLPSPSPSLPAPGSAGSLSKQDQESLLTAHFLASSLPHNFHAPPPPQAPSSQSHPLSQPPSALINAHHPSARSSESPGGFRQERQPLPPPHDHAQFAPHHLHDPAHLTENEHRVGGGGNGHARGHGVAHVANAGPPYGIPVPMEISEMDTLNRAHQQSGHGLKH